MRTVQTQKRKPCPIPAARPGSAHTHLLRQGVEIDRNALFGPSRKAIKIATPSIVEWIVDRAIQVHGAARLSQDFPLAEAFALSRTLRFAGGPGEVRKNAVADAELSRQRQRRRTRDVRRADRPSWIPDQTGHRDPSLASAEAPTGWA